MCRRFLRTNCRMDVSFLSLHLSRYCIHHAILAHTPRKLEFSPGPGIWASQDQGKCRHLWWPWPLAEQKWSWKDAGDSVKTQSIWLAVTWASGRASFVWDAAPVSQYWDWQSPQLGSMQWCWGKEKEGSAQGYRDRAVMIINSILLMSCPRPGGKSSSPAFLH